MSTAKITLIGLYNYNASIFDQLSLPSGIDEETLINNILFRSGDFEVMYPDADFLKPAIGIWSKKWERTFERWINALNVDYDPLNNYDRTEEWTINEDIDDTGSHSENATGDNVERSSNATNTSDQANTTSEETALDKVSAYNSATLQNDKQREVEISGTSSATGSVTGSGTVTNASNNSVSGNETKERDRVETRKGRAYGNIGVTTSQQMLQAELEIAEWNIYEHITDIFLQEFIIPVF